MLAICTGAEPRLDEILEVLLAELAQNKMRRPSWFTGVVWILSFGKD